MADVPTHIRLTWLTSQGTTAPVEAPVRRVTGTSAFVILATSHGPETRGAYELLDGDGSLVREGSCRIMFQHQGAGIGLELLAKPPLRRSSVPAPRRPSLPVPKLGPAPKLDAPGPTHDVSTNKTLRGNALAAERRVTSEFERPASVVPAEGKYADDAAPEMILGSAPPSPVLREPDVRPSSVDAAFPEEQGEPSDWPSVEESELSVDPEGRTSLPVFGLSAFPSAPPSAVPASPPALPASPPALPPALPASPPALPSEPSEPTQPSTQDSFDIERDERPSNTHVSFPPLGTKPDDPVEETKHSSAETEPPPPLSPEPAFELPELPKWDPSPPSEPPPRYDPGSWTPPVYEPGALGMGSNPPLTPYPRAGDAAAQEPPALESDASELSLSPPKPRSSAASRQRTSFTPAAPPLRESRSPRTMGRPREDAPPSVASQSQRKARVATRVSGTGAHGLTIGIDLGTSNTCASAVIDGVPQIIPTRFGTNTVPSVLTVIDSRIVVGHPAAKRMIMYPHETIYGSKRLVGRAFTAEIADEYQSSFAYPLVETEDHRFGASLNGRIISFEQVAEYLLAEVRDVAERHLGQKVHRAVITVPAYFGEAQRESIRRAARSAQLSVDRIVPEPTAAAVAYGYDAGDEHTLVVFDLGGGTFDVSVLKVGKNRFEVLATGGDAFLGGIDIDDLLANYLIEEFQRVERMTLEPTPQQLARLRDAAEIAKRDLSVQKRVAVNLPYFSRVNDEPRELRATLTRETLDKLSGSFVDRLIEITAATLSDCKLAPHDINDVLLVGGMTRMALVPERVEEYFGRRPSRRINPDEAVALGAARLAESGGKVELLDVLPLSIGVASKGRIFQRLVPRNTQVPFERSFTVRTEEADQDTFRLPLFQGEHPDAADNEYLGTLMVEEIPSGPAGSELELLFVLDEQCFLEVRAAHVASGRGLAVYINREEGADKAIAGLDSYTGPKKEKKKKKATGLGRFFQRLRSFFS
jgi:molecular chaperone DnaK